ncbi:MAG TPA: NAD(P)/FAD-dependent oxidoreductase [Thermoplasmata archaeon]|nr:NAD(P)/FAD-dependent oxidoreductase [Thermoplasmata archaeon]
MPGFPRLRDGYDFVIVGGGHAGLQAGLKAALLGHSAAIVDRGPKYSRSYYAPRLDNVPGFPDGTSGHKLLDLQIAAVRKVDAAVGYFTPARAERAEATDGGFAVTFDWLRATHVARGRVLVLAMGVVDRIPTVGGEIDPIFPWANQGLVNFCILCDGHEFPGLSVGVLGHDAFAARTALDLLHFGPRAVTLLTNGRPLLDGVPEPDRAALRDELAAHHIPAIEGAIAGFDELREKRFGVRFADGRHESYDRGFSALGWYEMHQAIPRTLGARFDADGYVETDEDCRALAASTGAPIPGLYVIGDQRNGWNQIPEAWATAERAVVHAYAEYL